MPNLTNSEAIAFNEDLNRYQAKEVALDRFNALVDSLVEYKIGLPEYDPYTLEHMTEAMDEMSDIRRATFSELISDFLLYGEAIHYIIFMRMVATEYWTGVARYDAVDEVEERMK